MCAEAVQEQAATGNIASDSFSRTPGFLCVYILAPKNCKPAFSRMRHAPPSPRAAFLLGGSTCGGPVGRNQAYNGPKVDRDFRILVLLSFSKIHMSKTTQYRIPWGSENTHGGTVGRNQAYIQHVLCIGGWGRVGG